MRLEEVKLPPAYAVEKAEMKIGAGEFCPISSFWLGIDYGELHFSLEEGDSVTLDVSRIEKVTKYKDKYTFVNKVPALTVVLKITKYKHIAAGWTGGSWSLCIGDWILYIDGKNCTKYIPKDKRSTSMDTYGTYSMWHFGGDMDEEWEDYEDGLEEDAWIEANKNWLSKLPIDESEYGDVFREFQKSDFRSGSCGGCI